MSPRNSNKDDEVYPEGWAGHGTPVAGVVNAVGGILGGNNGGSNQSYPEGWAGQNTPVSGVVNAVGNVFGGRGGGSNPSYPEGWAGQGTPVAGVVNAVGSIFGGGSSGSTRPAATPNAGPSGLMQAMSAGSIIQRSIQASMNHTGQRSGQTGSLFTGGPSTASARSTSTPTSRVTQQTGAQRMQAAQLARAARPISAERQRRVDIQSTYQTSTQKAADPLGWGNIAKDLGNAGDPRFRQYKTGQPASTNAQRIVGTQQRAAKAEVNRGRALQSASKATNAAKPKRGGKNSNRAV